MRVQLNNRQYDVVSIFHNAAYPVKISVGILSDALHTGASPVDWKASSKVGHTDFPLPIGGSVIESIKMLPHCAANPKVVSVNGVVRVFTRMCDSHVLTWFGVVDNVPMNAILGSSFTDRCIREIFTSEQKIFPWLLRAVVILWTQKITNRILTGTRTMKVHETKINDTSTEEHRLCCLARQIKYISISKRQCCLYAIKPAYNGWNQTKCPWLRLLHDCVGRQGHLT